VSGSGKRNFSPQTEEGNMKKISVIFLVVTVSATFAWSQMREGTTGGASQSIYPQTYSKADNEILEALMRISRGGQLYDDWWKTTTDTVKPEKDNPLWKEQSTNKRSGYDTYRCKECHGWDYRGKDGAYGKGSHYTGFKGVYEAAQKLPVQDIEEILSKMGAEKKHDFTKHVGKEEIADLAFFVKKGVIDTTRLVDDKGLPTGGSERTGRYIFRRSCASMCHGPDGTGINFGNPEEPEYVGTIAYENPWEFIHKVRCGQPGTRMPSAIINEWGEEEILDLLNFARTLPKNDSEVSGGSRYGGHMGRRGMMHRDYRPGSGRGFGPTME